MIKIDHIIPKQRFEVVLDHLGAILLEEMTNQKVLLNYNDNFEIYKERQEPIDKSEDVVINISIGSIEYSNNNAFPSDGSHTINIDVYVNGYESSSETGSEFSRLRLAKTVGIIRYIVMHDVHYNLKFEDATIMSRYISSINFSENNNQDGVFSRMARIELVYRFSETYQDNLLQPLKGNDTTVKQALTEKGFNFQFNN